jgi:cell division protease FtsH
MEKKMQLNIWYVMIAVATILLFQSWWTESRKVEPIPYSQFEQLLKSGKIEELAVRENYLEGKLRKPPPDGRSNFITTRVDPRFAELLSKYDVKFTGVIESHFLSTLLSWIVPVAVFALIWMFFIRKMAEKQGFGGLMTLSKSKAKVYVSRGCMAGAP